MIHSLKSHWPSLFCFFALLVFVQAVGGAVTFPNIPTWYMHLLQPPWSPPNWVFGPVWTTLYIIMAVFGWRLWIEFSGETKDKFKKPAMKFYFIQLFLNFLWSPFFFFFHWTWVSLADLLLIIFFTIKTIQAARKITPSLGWWLVPYLLWLCYAASLNAAIAVLNQ